MISATYFLKKWRIKLESISSKLQILNQSFLPISDMDSLNSTGQMVGGMTATTETFWLEKVPAGMKKSQRKQ